ncbi:hypothetical protein JW868_04715 [Candidatus Woesearchaeota archaeon]|nr:hypothetical protein [Candidatus Woesearchaeota archaeon]
MAERIINRIVMLFLIFIIAAAGLVGYLVAKPSCCGPIEPSGTEGIVKELDESIEEGLQYLHSARNDDLTYNDPYLQYIYAGEELDCPVEDCRITYRTLDAMFNLKFIDQDFDKAEQGALAQHIAKADEVMTAMLPQWRESRLYNIQNQGMIDPDGPALDTYCIMGLIYEDPEMALVVKQSLGGSDGSDWLPESFYAGAQAFRTVADESWCVRLLLYLPEDEQDDGLVEQLAEKLMGEADKLLEKESSLIYKANTVFHLLYMAQDLEDKGIALSIDWRTKYFHEMTDLLDHEVIQDDTLTVANIIDSLIYAGYAVPADTFSESVQQLLERQQPGGKWFMNINSDSEDLQVFTTFRVVLALKKYKDLLALAPHTN